MNEKVYNSCLKEILFRLQSFDVLEKIKPYSNDTNVMDIPELVGMNAENLLLYFQTYFRDKQTQAFNNLSILSNQGLFNYPCNINIPEEIRTLYNKISSNLKIFLDEKNSWDLYRKDVLRNIAFHEYLKNFNFKDIEIIEGYPKGGSYEEFKNLPIDIVVRLNSKIYTVYLPYFCGGLLSRDCLSTQKYYNVFKCQDEEFKIIKEVFTSDASNIEIKDTTTFLSKIKEKGISYKNYRNLLDKISQGTMNASDIWFLKNSLDPELTVDFSTMFKNNSKINKEDRRLIWILSQCIPPSIRFYLFEAIKPSYQYIHDILNQKTYRETRDQNISIIFSLLEQTVSRVNHIFLDLVNYVNIALNCSQCSIIDLIKLDNVVNQAFEYGDDFPIMIDYLMPTNQADDIIVHKSGKTISLSSGEVFEPEIREKKYIDYLPTDESTNINRIAFYVISALNFGRNLGTSENQCEDLNAALLLRESFTSRLQTLINGGYYKKFS